MSTIINNLKTPLGIIILITGCLQVYLVSFYEQLNFNYRLLFSKIPPYVFGYETFDLAKDVISFSVLVFFVLIVRMMIQVAENFYNKKRRTVIRILSKVERFDNNFRMKRIGYYLIRWLPFRFKQNICGFSLNYHKRYIRHINNRKIEFVLALVSSFYSLETILGGLFLILLKNISLNEDFWFWTLLIKLIVFQFFLIKILGSIIKDHNYYKGYRNTINAFLVLIFFHVLGVQFGEDYRNRSQVKEYEKITFCDLEKNENFSTNKSLTLLIVNGDEWVFRNHKKNENYYFQRSKMKSLTIGEKIKVD